MTSINVFTESPVFSANQKFTPPYKISHNVTYSEIEYLMIIIIRGWIRVWIIANI